MLPYLGPGAWGLAGTGGGFVSAPRRDVVGGPEDDGSDGDTQDAYIHTYVPWTLGPWTVLDLPPSRCTRNWTRRGLS